MKTKNENMIFHGADTRGISNHGWLDSRHTFSFANYFNPERVNFGVLRVLNDDIVKPGTGFGTHPHENMEIISIPISGSLAHKDSTGIEQEIKTGEVQIMSAGSGIYHSEYNFSSVENVNFLQIWILPKEKDINPRYDQKDYSAQMKLNNLVTIVSPEDGNSLWINQNAILSLGKLKSGNFFEHKLTYKDNGVYAFLIEGKAKINGTKLSRRDAVGYWDLAELSVQIQEDATLLLIEIPKIY